MAWQWAETLVEIRGTLAAIRGTTKWGIRCHFPKHQFNRQLKGNYKKLMWVNNVWIHGSSQTVFVHGLMFVWFVPNQLNVKVEFLKYVSVQRSHVTTVWSKCRAVAENWYQPGKCWKRNISWKLHREMSGHQQTQSWLCNRHSHLNSF